MKDEAKTRDQLIRELAELRSRATRTSGGESSELNVQLADPLVRGMLEASIDPYLAIDPDGRVCAANSATSRIIGCSCGELAGRLFHDLFSNREKALGVFQRACLEGEVRDCHLEFLHRDGGRIAVLFNALAHRNPLGQVVAVFGVAHDITTRERRKEELKRYREHLEELVEERTAELASANELLQQEISERRKAENALRRSEERFRRLAENAPDIIYRYELLPKRRYTYVSPAVKTITGHDPEEYYSDPELPFKLVHPDDRPLLEALFLHDMPTEYFPAVCLPALRWVLDDGSIVWTEEHAAPIYDEEGRLAAIEGIARNISLRKNAEQAQRMAHQQLLGIIEFLPDATFVIDRHRKVIAWNRAIEEMTNVRKDDILGKGEHAHAVPFYGKPQPILIDMVFDQTDEGTAGLYDFVAKKGNTLYAEAYVPMAYGGKGAYLWMAASPLYDENDELIGAIESIRDVTEHKQSEEALQVAHQKLLDIIDFLPDATFVIDQERKVIAWNRAIEKMTGVRKESILGKGGYAYGIPFYGEPRPILIDFLFSGDPTSRLNYDFIEKKGSTLYAEAYVPMSYRGKGAYLWIIASPLYDRNGRLIGAIESIRDITDRKKAEEALQKEKEYVGFIVSTAPNLICGIAPDGTTISANQMVANVTGYPLDQIIGRNWWELLYPGEEYAQVVQLFEDFRKGPVVNYEMTLTTRTGEKRVVSWNTINRCDSKGEVVEIIKIGADITEKKKMSEDLRINAEKIKLFAYSVSHDLKSPIIGINGLTRLLHRQCYPSLDEKGRKYCDQILKASELVVALIEEINVYIRTREIPLDFEMIKPKEIIGMVREEFGALLSIRQINWVEPDRIPKIKADRMSILRVFRNLVDNALKYGGEQLSEIRIGYAQNDEFHILSVSDNGVGIKDGDCEKIFGLFQRNQTSRGVEGTGLGLAIVKEIAEKHQGKVWAEPGLKNGATFYLYISKNL